MQASIILCLSQAKINWEGCGRNGIRCKNGEMMEVGAPVVRMGASRRIVPLVIFLHTIKTRRWQEIMEGADKGCSEFCITVGTVTRTAGILIHSQRHWL